MDLTRLNFKDEIGLPEVPTILTRVLKSSLPANSKTLVEVQQEPGAPL